MKKQDMDRVELRLPLTSNPEFRDALAELCDLDNRNRKEYLENLVIFHVKSFLKKKNKALKKDNSSTISYKNIC